MRSNLPALIGELLDQGFPKIFTGKSFIATLLPVIELIFKPKIHENQIPEIGLIISLDNPSDKIGKLVSCELGNALRFSDGRRNFVFFKGDQYKGLYCLNAYAYDDISLEVIRSQFHAAILILNKTGEAKLICEKHVRICKFRRWYQKEHANSMLGIVYKHYNGLDLAILTDFLMLAELCSSKKIGATLVISLNNRFKKKDSLPTLTVKDLNSRSLILNYLNRIDGATIFNANGLFLDGEVHLNYTANTQSILKPHKGTRHTSAKFYSFENPDVIIITISEDGPISIFSDGFLLGKIQTISASESAAALAKMVPEKSEDISCSTYEINCIKCGKLCVIEDVTITGWKEHEEAICPVCGEIVGTANCFELNVWIKKKVSVSPMKVNPGRKCGT